MSFVSEPDTFFSKKDGEMLAELRSEQEAERFVLANQPKAMGYCVGSPEYGGVIRVFARGSAKSHGEGWVTHTYHPEFDHNPEEDGPLFVDGFAESDDAGAQGHKWKRPGRNEGVHDEDHLSVFTTVSPNDLDQGELGDCWLISSLATVAEYPDFVMQLIDQQHIPRNGKYAVNLFDFAQGRMVKVEVDDRFPSAKHECAFVKITHDGELWPCIMEKAFAKMYGGYEKLDGGHAGFAFAAMSGSQAYGVEAVMYEKVDGQNVWNEWPARWTSNDTQSNAFTQGVRSQLSGEQLLALLEQYDAQNFPMCVCSHSGSDSDTNSKGIVQGHAFSLIQVKQNIAGSGVDLLQIRNPWGDVGMGEWAGEWSDNDGKWEEHPEVAQALGYVPQDDGLFWIDWFDFQDNYKKVWAVKKSLGTNRAKNLALKHMDPGFEHSEPSFFSYGLSRKKGKGGFGSAIANALGCLAK